MRGKTTVELQSDLVTLRRKLAARDAELATALEEVEGLREDLHEALGYVSDYFRRKHFAQYLDGNGELLATLAASREPEPAAQGKTSETSGSGNRQSHPKASQDGAVRIETSTPGGGSEEPGTSSDAEEVAERFFREHWDDGLVFTPMVADLAALLTRDRERVRRETIEECAVTVGALTITRNGKRAPLHVMLELQDRIRALAARGPKGE